MKKEYDVDDSGLQSKHIITKKTVLEFLPESLSDVVKDIRVVVDNNVAVWLIVLRGNIGVYTYTPYSHKIIFKPLGYPFGQLYLAHFSRYLRKEDKPEEEGYKYKTVYLCWRNIMILYKEVKELWFTQDEKSGPGCSWWNRLFRVYP